MLDKAIALAAMAFIGKFDKSGNPYILHCLHVMNKLKYDGTEDEQIAAVLHDLVEDTDYSFENLLAMGYSERVVDLLRLLTHEKDTPYKAYIEKIATDKGAIKIKIQDLRHNSDLFRIKGLREKDLMRVQKYHEAYTFLKQKLEEFK